MTDPEVLRTRIGAIRNRIVDAGGDPGRIDLLAVTKGFGPDVAAAAVQAGLTHLGENYAQELLGTGEQAGKAEVLATLGVHWHFIGRLQRNKVKLLAPIVTMWQTVDRLELGTEIAKRAPGAAVLVQVNVSDEPQKGGCAPADAATLVAQLTQAGLDVRGLMTVGRTGSPDEARAGFATLSRLADELDLPIRSMGMSSDLEVAVQEGSTMVRVGAALFGPRP